MIAQHVVFAQRRVDLAEQAAECFQFLRLGEFIENIAGQHQQVGAAGGNFLPQFGDAGVIHGCAGAGVDIADLHDAQSAMGQSFMRSYIIFCGTQFQSAAAAPPHDESRQQPWCYAIQPENAPNELRRTTHPAHEQRDAGTDAVKSDQVPGEHDAQAQRVAADVGQQQHKQQRKAVIQHRPCADQLQGRQLQKVYIQQHIQRRLANTRQDELKERMIHGGYQLLCISIVGAKGSPCAQRVRGGFSSGRHTGHPSVTFSDNSPQGEHYALLISIPLYPPNVTKY